MSMLDRRRVGAEAAVRPPSSVPSEPRRFSLRGAVAGFVALVVTAVLLPFGGQGAGAIATAVPLGTAAPFAVLGGSAVTSTGFTVLNGELGVSPGTSVTGFPPGIVNGAIHAADAVALQAQTDLTTAYNNAAGQPPDATLTGQDLGGLTLVPGVYRYATSAQLTGELTLDGQGNDASVFVFQVGSTLTTASASSVTLINGAQACNVFWQIGSSATLGTDTDFVGSILALTSITLNTNADIDGRALARNGAVTLDDNTITVSACAITPPTTPTTAAPTTSTTSTTTSAPTTTTVEPTSTTLAATTTSAAGPAATPTTERRSPRTSRGTASSVARRLPATGAQTDVTVLWAGSLVLVGAVLILLARHRIARSDDPSA